MQNILNFARKKATIPLLYTFIPLEMLPFLFETDSIIGKMLLICKFCLIFLLYILYLDQISRRNNVILGLLVPFMLLISIRNNSIGFFLLMMILFISLIVFPVVKVPEGHRRNMLLILGLVTCGLFIYTIYRPLVIAKEYFFRLPVQNISVYGVVNPNTCGYLILATFFYVVSFFEPSKSKIMKVIPILLLIFTLWFLYFTKCRSALLVAIAFVVFSLLNKLKLMKPALYYIEIIIVSLFCLVYCLLWRNIAELDQCESDLVLLGKNVFSGREKIWTSALEAFFKNPLWGNGSKYLLEVTGMSSAHNVLLGILTIMGFIPAIGYLYLLISVYNTNNSNRERNSYMSIPQLCFAASIISTAFECSLTDARLNFLFLPLILFDNVKATDVHSIQAL